MKKLILIYYTVSLLIMFGCSGSESDNNNNDDSSLNITNSTTVFDFESGMPAGYFADPGGQIDSTVLTADTTPHFGNSSNKVLAVAVNTPRAWAGLQGFNLSSAQDWSTFDGVCFWFKGTNSGITMLFTISQGDGGGLYQATFTDDSDLWKLVYLPWDEFYYREGASGTPVLNLTDVNSYFIQFSSNGGDTTFTGIINIDQICTVSISK